MTHASTYNVTFGDCDPAGIVFYPNMFRWMDATFHDHLKKFGGCAKLFESVNARGLGLASAEAQFRSPITHGDVLQVALDIESWSNRSVTIRYTAHCGDRLIYEGREVRCLFKDGEKGIFAAPIDEVKRILEGAADG